MSFKPPQSAINNAKRGLKLRQEWGRGGLSPAEAKAQGIDSGVTRARKISSGTVSEHDVRRMSAFNRHRQNYRPEKKMPDGGPTAGTIAWLLWGGTSGVNWAKKKSAAMNAESFASDEFTEEETLEELYEDYLEELDTYGHDGPVMSKSEYGRYLSDMEDKTFDAETFEAEKCKCNNYTPDFNREKPMDASWSKIGQIESYEWDDEDDEQAVIVPITCDDCGRKGETVYLYGYNEYDDSNLKWFEAETFESDPEEWKQSGFNHHGDLPFKEMDKIYKDNRKQRKYNMNHPKDGSKVPLSRRDYWELFEDDTVDDGGDLLMVEALYEDKSSRNKFYGLTFYFDLTNHTSPYKINPNDENSYRWDYSNFNFDPVNPRGYASLIISDGNEEGRIISSHRFKEMNAETFESPATVNNFWANCHDGKFGVLGRKIYYNCRLFASISTGAAVVSNPVGFYADGRSKLRYSSRLSKSNSPEVEIVKSLSNKEQPSSVEDWYNLFDKANMELNKQFQAETEEIAYSDAEINLMRYDIVEHELENSDYNFLYDVLLYGTPGWANYTDEEVVRHFRNIFER